MKDCSRRMRSFGIVLTDCIVLTLICIVFIWLLALLTLTKYLSPIEGVESESDVRNCVLVS